MKKNYVVVEIEIIEFTEEEITTASVVVGGEPLPGEENVDGSDIFGF